MTEADSQKLYSQADVDVLVSKELEQANTKIFNLQQEIAALRKRVQELEAQPIILSGLESAIQTAEQFRSKGRKDKRGEDGILMDGFRFLGSGANAEAYDVTNAIDNSTTVLKMIPFRGMSSDVVMEELEKARKEAVLQQMAYRICPSGVVELRQVFQYIFPGLKASASSSDLSKDVKKLPQNRLYDRDRCVSYSDSNAPWKAMLVLSLEKCDHGDLVVYLENLSSEGTANEYFKRALPLLLQVASAVVRLASKGIEHKDLHGRNVFVTEGISGVVAKIGDFGIADEDEVPNKYFCESVSC